MASSQQQHRTSGGAGVGGSYGPTSGDADARCKTALSTDQSLEPRAGSSGAGEQPQAAAGQQQDLRLDSQAGDASGVSRTSGGAGIGGSYGPAMMAEAAKRTSEKQAGEAQDAAAGDAPAAEQVQQRSKL